MRYFAFGLVLMGGVGQRVEAMSAKPAAAKAAAKPHVTADTPAAFAGATGAASHTDDVAARLTGSHADEAVVRSKEAAEAAAAKARLEGDGARDSDGGPLLMLMDGPSNPVARVSDGLSPMPGLSQQFGGEAGSTVVPPVSTIPMRRQESDGGVPLSGDGPSMVPDFRKPLDRSGLLSSGMKGLDLAGPLPDRPLPARPVTAFGRSREAGDAPLGESSPFDLRAEQAKAAAAAKTAAAKTAAEAKAYAESPAGQLAALQAEVAAAAAAKVAKKDGKAAKAKQEAADAAAAAAKAQADSPEGQLAAANAKAEAAAKAVEAKAAAEAADANASNLFPELAQGQTVSRNTIESLDAHLLANSAGMSPKKVQEFQAARDAQIDSARTSVYNSVKELAGLKKASETAAKTLKDHNAAIKKITDKGDKATLAEAKVLEKLQLKTEPYTNAAAAVAKKAQEANNLHTTLISNVHPEALKPKAVVAASKAVSKAATSASAKMAERLTGLKEKAKSMAKTLGVMKRDVQDLTARVNSANTAHLEAQVALNAAQAAATKNPTTETVATRNKAQAKVNETGTALANVKERLNKANTSANTVETQAVATSNEISTVSKMMNRIRGGLRRRGSSAAATASTPVAAATAPAAVTGAPVASKSMGQRVSDGLNALGTRIANMKAPSLGISKGTTTAPVAAPVPAAIGGVVPYQAKTGLARVKDILTPARFGGVLKADRIAAETPAAAAPVAAAGVTTAPAAVAAPVATPGASGKRLLVRQDASRALVPAIPAGATTPAVPAV